jgi:FAD/FMN-containing dehydrogenase
VAGLEVVLPDGTLVRTGAWALSDVPFGLVPFPDVTGLFISWAGATGIVTKCAFQLWPRHPLSRRFFVLFYSVPGTYRAMRRLCKKEICDDIGATSWPSAKMMMGVKKPHPEPSEGEPVFFLYVDLTAETEAQMNAKEAIFRSVLEKIASEGDRFEDPLEVDTLVGINPGLKQFADFPVDLKFLTDHGGGGLSWIGTYGPLSRFEEAAEAGMEIMSRHSFPPLIVSRAMRGGHFGVLRLITTFDKKDPEEVEAVRAVNAELLDAMTERGFIMYKTPAWAWKRLREKVDPGMLELVRRIKRTLDPDDILNPGKLP